MAGHPAAVRSLLLSLLDAVKAPARAELHSLQRLADQSPPATDGLQAWDQQYYRQLAMVSAHLPGCQSLRCRVALNCAPSVTVTNIALLTRQQ